MNIEQLRKDMVTAMKAKDKPRKEAISSLSSTSKREKSNPVGTMLIVFSTPILLR